MKTITHVVLPIGIVVVLVGVVAYVTQNTSRPPSTNGSQPAGDKPSGVVKGGEFIVFDEFFADDPKPIVVEPLSENNHHDTWFHNPQTQVVQICAKYKSCTCSDLEIGSVGLSNAEWEAVQKYPSLTGWCKLAASVKFVPLPDRDVKDNNRISIPSQKPHLLRIKWKAKGEAAADGLRLQIQAEAPNGAADVYTRRLGFTVLPAVGHYPLILDVGDIFGGDTHTIEFLVWSETRDRLRIKPRVLAPGDAVQDEPCAEVSEAIEVPIKNAHEELIAANKAFGGLRMQCAYLLKLTVHERRGDKQFDMGPLTRRVALNFDTEADERPLSEVRVPLTGLVKGEVRLLTGDDKERISLGTYKYEQRRTVTARLAATDPTVELELVSTANARLHAQISPPKTEAGRRVWDLKVEMEPNAILGELPASTVVTLRTKGANSRILRIPVTGRAER